MDEDVLVQELVDRLTFEVETLPDKVVKVPNANGTPLNVKVRVRNKDEPKLIKRGVISVAPGNQIKAAGPRQVTAPGIQLIGSDQTILSFNVFMEASSSKENTLKNRKHGFQFFKLGGCLATSYDQDDAGPYLPSTSNKDTLRSKGGSKSDSLIMDEVHNLEEVPLETLKTNTMARNQKGIFGKCKPGGCLDPPFDEDKYPYTIPKVQPQINAKLQEVDNTKEDMKALRSGVEQKQSIKDANESLKTTETVNETETEPKPIVNIFARTGEEHPLESSYSNAIITYPPVSTASKTGNNNQNGEKRIKIRSFDSSAKHSFEYTETYFIPPKDILRHREEERKYSRELSDDKIKLNDDGHQMDTKHGVGTFENLKKINLKGKDKTEQELNKQSDLKISDSGYLTNQSLHRRGENEDKSKSENLDPENKNNTIGIKEIAPAAILAASTYIVNERIQAESPSKLTEKVMSLDTYPHKDVLRSGENEDDINTASALDYKTTKYPDSVNEKNAVILTDSMNKDEYGYLKDVPVKAEKQEISSSGKDILNPREEKYVGNDSAAELFSNSENKNKINLSPYSEAVTSAPINLDSVLSKANGVQMQETSPSNKDKILSSGLKATISPTNQVFKDNAFVEDTKVVTGNTNIDQVSPTTIENKDGILSRDSILSENKDFATSSIDSIDSTENQSTYGNTKKKDKVLGSQTNNGNNELNEDRPLNVNNVIIRNDMLQPQRSSAIFQKTPFLATDEPSIYYDDIGKINSFRHSTIPTIDSKTSLQKQIEEISTQHNDFDHQVKIDKEFVLVDSQIPEQLNQNLIISNSNTTILPKETKLLPATPSEKREGDAKAVTTPTELDSQLHHTEDVFDIIHSVKPIFDANSIANSAKESKDLVSDTQFPNARDNAVNNKSNAENDPQLSTISLGNVDILPELLNVGVKGDMKTMSPIVSVTRSPEYSKAKYVTGSNVGVVDDNQLKSDAIMHQTLNQNDERKNISSGKNVFHPTTTDKPDNILLNLSFQSYINENDERIVQTLNPLEKSQLRYVDDTVTTIQSLIRQNEIRIPVDRENDLILNILNKNRRPEYFDNVNTRNNEVNNEAFQSDNSIGNRSATHPEDRLKENLSIIYENELIPLHNVITNLTKEINAVSVQQELLKIKLRDAKRSRSLRLIPVNNRCGCRRT